MSKPKSFPAVTVTHLDLFSGIGGFAIAAQNCGYTTVGFCEREPYAQQILKERFGAVLAEPNSEGCEPAGPAIKNGKTRTTCQLGSPQLHPDIFTLDGSDYAGVDLLTGGFPCQPFSVAGQRAGAADDRHLWPQIVRLLREMDACGGKPDWCIFENVPGIIAMELDNCLDDMESLGYSAWPLVIPACAVDARHRRDRVWIVAHAHSGRGEQRDKNERSLSKPDSECAGIGEDVADSESAGLERRDQHGPQLESELGFREGGIASEAMSHTDGQRGCLRETHGTDASDARQSPCTWKDEREWFAESGMGRVAHGIPHRAHRLRGLGNAIVPQVAEEIIRAIASLR